MEAEKREWCPKFESILAEVNNNWDKPVIITGDFNIDLLAVSTSKLHYKNILDTFHLVQTVPILYYCM